MSLHSLPWCVEGLSPGAVGLLLCQAQLHMLGWCHKQHLALGLPALSGDRV